MAGKDSGRDSLNADDCDLWFTNCSYLRDTSENQISTDRGTTAVHINCHEPGAIHIGINGGDSRWICFRHLERWNKNRARLRADGGGCEMQELGELLGRED